MGDYLTWKYAKCINKNAISGHGYHVIEYNQVIKIRSVITNVLEVGCGLDHGFYSDSPTHSDLLEDAYGNSHGRNTLGGCGCHSINDFIESTYEEYVEYVKKYFPTVDTNKPLFDD